MYAVIDLYGQCAQVSLVHRPLQAKGLPRTLGARSPVVDGAPPLRSSFVFFFENNYRVYLVLIIERYPKDTRKIPERYPKDTRKILERYPKDTRKILEILERYSRYSKDTQDTRKILERYSRYSKDTRKIPEFGCGATGIVFDRFPLRRQAGALRSSSNSNNNNNNSNNRWWWSSSSCCCTDCRRCAAGRCVWPPACDRRAATPRTMSTASSSARRRSSTTRPSRLPSFSRASHSFFFSLGPRLDSSTGLEVSPSLLGFYLVFFAPLCSLSIDLHLDLLKSHRFSTVFFDLPFSFSLDWDFLK